MIEATVFALQAVLLITGCLFFAVGTVGLFRFVDTSSRIHALTKVDNLGLGCIVLGVLPLVPSLAAGLKIVLIWLVVLASSATSAHLVARAVRLHGPADPAGEEQAGD